MSTTWIGDTMPTVSNTSAQSGGRWDNEESGPLGWPVDYASPWGVALNASGGDIWHVDAPHSDSLLDHGYSLLPTHDLDLPGFVGIGVNFSNGSLWGGGGTAAAPGEEAYSALEWCRDIALGMVLASLSLLTFVGNAMVLHAVRTERRLQSVSNMFIVSLAIADLIVGLIVMPISSIYIFTLDWLFGVGVCQFWIGVDYTASTASILNLFILSLDRYWSVSSPLKYLRQRTKRRALIMISLVWFASSLWLIPIIGWHHFEHAGLRTVPDDVCDTEYATNTALKIITGLLNFYLPLAVMYGLYGKIFSEIRRRSKMELGQRISGGTADNTYINGSLSEDSDDKEYVDAIPLRLNKTAGVVQQNGRAMLGKTKSLTSTTSSLRRATDTETDITDDEVVRLHKGGYTNLTLVDLDTDIASHCDAYSPSADTRADGYVYDESVLESNTERVHRYFYSHQQGSNSANHTPNHTNGTTPGLSVDQSRLRDISRVLTTDDTNSNNRVRFCIDPAENNQHSVLPKETHPAKNTYVVKPRCYRNARLSTDSEQEDRASQPSNSTRIPHASPTNKPHAKLQKANSAGLMTKKNSISYSRQSSRSSATRSSGSRSSASRQSSSSSGHKVANRQNSSTSTHHHSRHISPQDSALVRQAVRWRSRVEPKRHRPSSALSKEIKAARQLGVIMGAFTVCFLPYFVCFMVVAFCDHCVDPSLMTAVTWVGYLNSTLNPFLYPMCNINFRRKFRDMLHLSRDIDRRRNSVYYAHSRHSTLPSAYDI